jgi:DNA (cytosine-5)-methyltransferase 1
LKKGGYRYGALIVDAAVFLPQSRPRLFIVAVREDVQLPLQVSSSGPDSRWSTPSLRRAFANLPAYVRDDWVWWKMPPPVARSKSFADLIEEEPSGVEWHTPAETLALLSKMNHVNRLKVEKAKRTKRRLVGAVYKRTRFDTSGEKIQRAEVRFDGIAGCLRTPAGGSSRQIIMVVDGTRVRTRLISARETARLMGLDDDYMLPPNYNEAYHLTGDGVAVPAVRHLAKHILEPIITSSRGSSTVAA